MQPFVDIQSARRFQVSPQSVAEIMPVPASVNACGPGARTAGYTAQFFHAPKHGDLERRTNLGP
eukprot:4866260-Pyramimonas_sp.AAC.1